MFQSPVFSSLSVADRNALLQQSRLLHLAHGEALTSVGQTLSDVFYISAGLLRLAMPVATGKTTVAFLKQGEVHGETVSQPSYVSSCDATATVESGVYALPLNVVKEVLLRHPQAALLALEESMGRIRKLQTQLRRVATASSVSLGRTLYDIAHVRRDGTRVVDKRVTQSQLASHLGLSRETVNKRMRQLEEQGFIKRVEDGLLITQAFAQTDMVDIGG